MDNIITLQSIHSNKINIEPDKILLNDFEIDEPKLINFFHELQVEQEYNEEQLHDKFLGLLYLGLMAEQAVRVGEKVDYVKEGFNSLKQDMENQIENNFSTEFDLKNQIIHRKTFKNYFSKNIINANTTEIAIVILIMLKNGSCRVSILPAKSARSGLTLFLLLFKKFIYYIIFNLFMRLIIKPVYSHQVRISNLDDFKFIWALEIAWLL